MPTFDELVVMAHEKASELEFRLLNYRGLTDVAVAYLLYEDLWEWKHFRWMDARKLSR